MVLTKIPGKPTSQKTCWVLIAEEAKHQIVVGDVNGFGYFFIYVLSFKQTCESMTNLELSVMVFCSATAALNSS